MKRLGILAAVAALAAAIAHADSSLDNLSFALTTTDTVPTSHQLDLAEGSGSGSTTTIQNLTQLASSAPGTVDSGVQLRAIQALSTYCPPTNGACISAAHAALSTAIQNIQMMSGGEHPGTDLLILRAAIESIGPLQVQTDLDGTGPGPAPPNLVEFLDNPSRDIRAAAAHALRDLCNANAIIPLKQRYAVEPVKQVQLAISEALRVLPCP